MKNIPEVENQPKLPHFTVPRYNFCKPGDGRWIPKDSLWQPDQGIFKLMMTLRHLLEIITVGES